MPLKITGALLIASACFAIGCFMSRGLRLRRDFYRSMTEFTQSLSTRLRFSAGDIFTEVNECLVLCGLDLLKVERETELSFEQCWQRTLESAQKLPYLKKEDIALLSQFGSQLGKTDISGQLSHLELYSQQFEDCLKTADGTAKQKSGLYRSLGFFAGAAAAILMI